ncbi:unnamed protein product [Closterium sp. NIES-53]
MVARRVLHPLHVPPSSTRTSCTCHEPPCVSPAPAPAASPLSMAHPSPCHPPPFTAIALSASSCVHPFRPSSAPSPCASLSPSLSASLLPASPAPSALFPPSLSAPPCLARSDSNHALKVPITSSGSPRATFRMR